MDKIKINYGLDDDSLYFFENISKTWLHNLGLTEPSNSYYSYSQKVVKFHVLLVILEKIHRESISLVEVMNSINNDFVRMSLRLPAISVSFFICLLFQSM